MAKKVLITTGSTQIPIDSVRVISNIFRGRTGSRMADYLASCDWDVTILTSFKDYYFDPRLGIKVYYYKTYDQLMESMETLITTLNFDVIIHSAAVSDYRVDSVQVMQDGQLVPVDRSAKISSQADELFLKMVPTEKIIDKIRSPWGFTGKLVKFKLQVNISDDDLIAIARKSRLDSQADIIVANCLEWMGERVFIINSHNDVIETGRSHLPYKLKEVLEGETG